MNKLKFEFIDRANVVGVCNNKKIVNKFLNQFTRVGGVSVRFLKDFLEKIDDELDMAEIGIYINKKKELVPIHCRGVFLAPRISPKERLKDRLRDEGR